MASSDVYLDNAATTRPHPAVVEAMQRALTEEFGNPSSLHGKGLAAERRVTAARDAVARTLAVSADELVFTSGGTESNNLALLGLAQLVAGRHVITTAVEHASVLTPARRLAARGYALTVLPVDGEGRTSPADVARAIRPDTFLVSVMAVNNEVGTIQPIEEIGRVIRERSTAGRHVYYHVDAIQAWGKIAVRPRAWHVDLLSLSGHKVHGPKGAGVLYVRNGVRLAAVQGGGDQERGLRPGTENVPGIAGLGAAASLLGADLEEVAPQMGMLRDRLRRAVAAIPDVRINTPSSGAAPHILNVAAAGVAGETLLHRLEMDGVFTSTGSACHAHDPTPSHVLLAMGLPADLARGALRFSLSRFTTAGEIDAAVTALQAALAELRPLVR